MMYKTVLIVAFVAATALSVFAAEPKIPGADDVLASGFDAVTNKPGLPIFDFLYDGQTFQPFGSNKAWSVPQDLVARQTGDSKDQRVIKTQNSLSTHETEVNKQRGISLGINYSGVEAKVSYDKQSKKASSMYEKKEYESGSANHFWSSYRLMAPPADWLNKHPFFERAVSSLPASIASAADHKKYTDVISRFGTHYVYECNFGARVSTDSFVESSEVKTHSSEWKKTSMSASISYKVFDLGITDAKEKSDIKTDEEYDAASETIVYYEGGDPTLQNDKDQKPWVQSIFDFPARLNVTVDVIDSLLTGSKAANFQTIANAYMSAGAMPTYASWTGAAPYVASEETLYHQSRARAFPASFWAQPAMMARAEKRVLA